MSASLYCRLTRRYRAQPSAVSRREFLRLALTASAGLLISSAPARARSADRRRVIVIGAGFSGLACAHELIAAGCAVTVLEARNRIGGRVLSFSDMVRGKVVEGGGELIGSNHPTWMAFARKFGLRFNDVTEDEDLDAPIFLEGKRLSRTQRKALWEEMNAAFGSMNADAASINEDEPWKSAHARQLDARATADWVRRLDVSEICKRAITVQLSADNGVATSRQSYLASLTQVKGGGLEKYWTESEVYRCRGGNAQLARKLADAIGDGRVHLETPACEVRLLTDKVVVRDAAGRSLEADDVVLAIPPSTWHHIRFSPELPDALRPQMGVNVKYLAGVQRRFWLQTGLAPKAFSDGVASMTWEGTDNQGSDDDGAVLTCFSGGPAAERARQSWAHEQGAAYGKLLNEMYPGFSANLVRGRFMNWPNEKWTAAGYSFPAPGQVTTIGPLLRAGIGRLHFAGEHTCLKFVGYMEGALNSGVSVAKRIMASDAATSR